MSKIIRELIKDEIRDLKRPEVKERDIDKAADRIIDFIKEEVDECLE